MSNAVAGVLVSIAILAAIGLAWVWGVVQLFDWVDAQTLPPRARRLYAPPDPSPATDAVADDSVDVVALPVLCVHRSVDDAARRRGALRLV